MYSPITVNAIASIPTMPTLPPSSPEPRTSEEESILGNIYGTGTRQEPLPVYVLPNGDFRIGRQPRVFRLLTDLVEAIPACARFVADSTAEG